MNPEEPRPFLHTQPLNGRAHDLAGFTFYVKRTLKILVSVIIIIEIKSLIQPEPHIKWVCSNNSSSRIAVAFQMLGQG